MEQWIYGVKREREREKKRGCPSNKGRKQEVNRKDDKRGERPKEIVISERFHRRNTTDGKATLWVPKKGPTEERP